MKRLKNIFTIILVLLALENFAQAPEHINYQAVLRNTNTGIELRNQPVYLVVQFLDGGKLGDIVYQEEHANVQTNSYGLINIQLGAGSPIAGNFGDIPWESGDIWLSLEVDSGEGLQPVGTTEFSSVPYALFAASANSTPDGDGDATNEIQDLSLTENTLKITNNPTATEIDLSPYVNPAPDGDGSSINEIQDLSLTGNTLTITNNESASAIDLTPYVNVPDNDSDPTNELITSFTYNSETGIMELQEGGETYTHDLSGLAGGEPDGDGSSTNEIQDLSLTGNTLKITNNPSATDIDMSPYVNPAPDGDGSSTNELQDLDLSGNTLKITNNASASDIDLSPYVNNTTDEIQDLSLTGNTLTITNNASATDIDLSPYVNPAPDGDGSSTNEIQDLELSGNTLKITNNASATDIDLSPYVNPAPDGDGSSTNEIQDLELSGNTLKITNNASATDIDLSPYVNPAPDGDGSSTNEIQDLELSGNTLKITNNASATDIDLSPYVNPAPDGDGSSTNEIQDLELSGNTLTITNNASATDIDLSPYVNPAPDGDGSSTNEIQDLSFSGDTLKITNNASATGIDLASFRNPSLPSNTIFIGNASGVATPRAISGDISANTTGTVTVKGIQTTPVASTAPSDGDVLVYDQTADEWVPKALPSASPTTKYYSVDPMDFVELTNPNSGADLNLHNAVKYYNTQAPFAMIYNSSIKNLGAPVHLPDGVVISKVTFYVKDRGSDVLKFALSTKELANYATTNTAIVSGSTNFLNGNGNFELIPSNETMVDNSKYNYRILIEINDDELDDDASVGDIQQVVYGVVIEYY